jgi:nucleoside-diphosphate-sugar epimerase
MKAIVTGATGFTGSALCRRLVRDGWDITAFVRQSPRVEPLRELGIECVEVDITDAESVRAAMRPVDCVFHVAALFRTEDTDRDMFKRVNVDAAENMAGAARAVGVGRYIHCSTVGVQGQIDDPPADETYRFRPNDHYQRTKLEGEEAARRHISRGLPGVVVRPAGIYGPGDMRFLKLFKAIDRGMFVMIGSGNTLYHLTYIDDLIDGFMLAASKPEAPGEIFTIGGPRYTTIREMVEVVADILGKSPPRWRVPLWPVQVAAVVCEAVCKPLKITPILYPRRVEFFAMDRGFTIEKARRLLGYAPQFDIDAGLRNAGDWYRQRGLL